ncbi:natural cytotoxicity triggering receptor 3-like [Mantella aurantiaca]
MIHVWQIPVIWASEGSSVTLACDYNVPDKKVTIGSYKWYRHILTGRSEVSDNNMNFSGRISIVDQQTFIRRRSAAITLHSVELSDSGMYYCEVILQDGLEISADGNGTFLNVTGEI